MEKSDGEEMLLACTPEAAAYVLRYMAKEGKSPPLRIFLRSIKKGCGTSEIAFACGTMIEAGDTRHEVNGLCYVVNYLEFPELRGGRIELAHDSVLGSHLRFVPSASSGTSCGCGKAFSPKQP